MNTSQWTKVAELAELKEKQPKHVTVEKNAIMLVKIDDQIRAYGNNCPHYGAPLHKGYVSHHEVTCPWHNARFDLKTGAMTAAPGLDDLPEYEVNVKENEIYIKNEPIEKEIQKLDIKDSPTFLIVGGGAAGNAAAETLRKQGFDGRLVMLSADKDRPYDRPVLSKGLLAGEAKKEWLPLRSADFYKEQSIELITGTRVTEINSETHVATVENGDQYNFDKCLIATGAVPNMLRVPGADLKNIFTLRSFQDAQRMDETIRDAEHIVIVGAGFIGLEAAASLQERGLSSTIVAPEEIPMAPQFGKEVGRFFQKLHENNDVDFHLGKKVTEFRGTDTVQAVVLSDGQSLEADMVLVAIGVSPAVDFLQNTGLVENGAIPVDAQLNTKSDDIYAAGDIALVPHPFTHDVYRIEHWVVAERQGQHAAKNMLGKNLPYQEVPFFWTRQYGQPFKAVGYLGTFDTIAIRGDVSSGEFLAGYFSDGQLNAAATVGLGDDLVHLEQLIFAGKTVTPNEIRSKNYDLGSVA